MNIFIDIKKKAISTLILLFVLAILQSSRATPVYIPKPVASHHQTRHAHSSSEVRKSKPPEEELVNGNRSSRMFLSGGRKNVQSGKKSNMVYAQPVASFAHYRFRPVNNNLWLPMLTRLILFPFHAFW